MAGDDQSQSCAWLSPVALRVARHHARPAPDHEPAGGLLRDHNRERDAGEGEPEPQRSKMRCRIQRGGGIFGKRAMSPANWTQGCALSQ
jgi:hypothetical protein